MKYYFKIFRLDLANNRSGRHFFCKTTVYYVVALPRSASRRPVDGHLILFRCSALSYFNVQATYISLTNYLHTLFLTIKLQN